MPMALAAVFGFIKTMNKLIVQGISKVNALEAINFLMDCDKILGLQLDMVRIVGADDILTDILNLREKARFEKKWTKSDKLRKEILALGYEVEDTANGQIIKKI